jgi:hypothetical protein
VSPTMQHVLMLRSLSLVDNASDILQQHTVLPSDVTDDSLLVGPVDFLLPLKPGANVAASGMSTQCMLVLHWCRVLCVSFANTQAAQVAG